MSITDRSKELISFYGLKPHPEGGFYRQTYVSDIVVPAVSLPKMFGGDRHVSTAIYFLLPAAHFSAFHRIKSDEFWHFYEGTSLLIHVIDPVGEYTLLRLGKDMERGDAYQHVVKAGSWFAAETSTDEGYGFVGCTVSPGFDFIDFELAKKQELLKLFPDHGLLINRLCRD